MAGSSLFSRMDYFDMAGVCKEKEEKQCWCKGKEWGVVCKAGIKEKEG